MRRVNNPGYTDDGTFKWPNGQIFLLRNSGYNNDNTVYYPNGQIMYLQNTGYTNHGTIYWPNGKILLRKNSGYTNDNTLYNSNGSEWSGGPVETVKAENFTAKARTSNSGLEDLTVMVKGDGWALQVNMPGDGTVTVKECY